MRLMPRLVPQPLWSVSAHRLLPTSAWRRIRAKAMEASGGACVVCGARREKRMVADEVWDYRAGVATLTTIRIVCPDCNAVTHIGSTAGRGYGSVARDHMAKVNGVSIQEADNVIKDAFRQWRKLSLMTWRLSVAPDLLERHPELAVIQSVGPARLTPPV